MTRRTKARPLSKRQEQLCQALARGLRGAEAGRAAGYRDGPGLSTTVSRAVRNASVLARLRELGVDPTGESARASRRVLPTLPPDATPEEVFRSVIADPDSTKRELLDAGERLAQLYRRTRELERGDDAFTAMRKKVAAIIAKRSLPDSLRHLARRHPEHAGRLEALATEVES